MEIHAPKVCLLRKSKSFHNRKLSNHEKDVKMASVSEDEIAKLMRAFARFDTGKFLSQICFNLEKCQLFFLQFRQ